MGTKTGTVYSPFYNGYLGLLPYSFHDSFKEESFMYKLKKDGLISKMQVAFYVRHEDNNPLAKSSIKFGGYDPNGFADKDAIGIFKTQSLKTWALSASAFLLHDEIIVN